MERIVEIIGGLLILMLIGVLMALPVQILWNGCLTHAIDGVNSISFWEALGINLLCSILFNNITNSKNYE